MFHYLLQKAAFPYKECQPSHPLDGALLSRLKENYCHLNLVKSFNKNILNHSINLGCSDLQDLCGLRDVNFVVERPEKPIMRYQIKVNYLTNLFQDSSF